MRILMITDVYFPRINGVSTSIQTFRNDLRALGHDVTLLAPQYGQDATDDAGIMRVAGRSVPRDPEDRLMRRRAIRRMIPEIARRQPELVHIHTPFVAHYAGIEIARALGVPVVTTYHTYFEHYFEHYVPFLPKRWLAALARQVTVGQCAAADLVISPSHAMLDALRAYGAQGRIAVLPTGLGDGCYTPGDGRRFRAAYGIAAERPIVLHVGRAAHEKNIDFLIRMLQPLKRAVPNVLMVIAGEGPALMHLKDLAQRLGVADSVQFVGYLERNYGLPDCYAAGDVFAFSSRTETQGLVLLEAMAQGTPVVSNAEMGTRDVLVADRGARILPLDEQAFAAAVAQVIGDRGLRAQMSDAAREHARGWSSRTMAERLSAHYQELVAARQRDAGSQILPVAVPSAVGS
jgi:glycosyltransferase involved in cell wall biosynthesis